MLQSSQPSAIRFLALSGRIPISFSERKDERITPFLNSCTILNKPLSTAKKFISWLIDQVHFNGLKT